MTAIRQAFFLLALAAVPAAIIGFFLIDTTAGDPANGSALKPGEVELSTVQAWPKVLWVDARSLPQFERGHIPDAVSLTEEHWDEDLARLFDHWEPETNVVVYCDSTTCDTSRRVAARLRDEVGLENVQVLRGGWEAWQGRSK